MFWCDIVTLVEVSMEKSKEAILEAITSSTRDRQLSDFLEQLKLVSANVLFFLLFD